MPEQCSDEIAAVLCQGSGGVYKRVSAADEAVVPAAEAESCRCRSGQGNPACPAPDAHGSELCSLYCSH